MAKRSGLRFRTMSLLRHSPAFSEDRPALDGTARPGFPALPACNTCDKLARRANHFRFTESCQALKRKIFLFTVILIYGINPASPCHHEGRFAVVTKRGAGCDGPLRRQVISP